MGKGDHYKLIATFVHNNVIGEAFQNEALPTSLLEASGHDREWDQIFLKEIERGIHRLRKLRSKSRTLRLIPFIRLLRQLPRPPRRGCAVGASVCVSTCPHPPSQLVAIDQCRRSRVNLREPPQDFSIPCVGGIGVNRGI
jgi:hypothetical protein